MKGNCNFAYYFNNTNIKPTVLHDGNEVILANWLKNKHIESNINNDILVRIPSFPYVLLNSPVLCNCEIEAEYHIPLESLAACEELESKLTMYFAVNYAFVNYFDNLHKSLEFPIFCIELLMNKFYQFF